MTFVLSTVPTTRTISGSFQPDVSVDRIGLRAIANSWPSAVIGSSCSSRWSVQQMSSFWSSQSGGYTTFCAPPKPMPRSPDVNTTTGLSAWM